MQLNLGPMELLCWKGHIPILIISGLNLRQDVALGPKIKKSMKWVAVAPFATIFAGIVSYGPPGPPGIGPRA